MEFQKFSYGEWMQTFATLMFTKVSICLFLLRIVISERFVRPLQAIIFILITSNVVLTLLWILHCRPLLRAWNTAIPGNCFTDVQLQNIILAQASKSLSTTNRMTRRVTTEIDRIAVISVISDSPLLHFLSSCYARFTSVCGLKWDCIALWVLGLCKSSLCQNPTSSCRTAQYWQPLHRTNSSQLADCV